MGLFSHDNVMILSVGILLADIGTAILILFWGNFWTQIRTERMGTHLIVSNIFACMLYFLIVSLPPEPMVFVIALLPLFSGLTLLGSKDEPPRERIRSSYTIPPSIWKLIIALLIIPISYSIVRTFFAEGSLSLFGASYQLVMFAFAFFSVVTALTSLTANSSRTITKLYRVSISLILFGLISLIGLPTNYQWVSFGSIMVGYSLFGELLWLMHPKLDIKIGASEISLFGWSRLLFHTFAFMGSLFGIWLLNQTWFSDTALTVASMVLTMLTVGLATNILTDQDFNSFISPISVENISSQQIPSKETPESLLDKNCTIMAQEYGLSKRETEVLLLLSRGRSLPHIEKQLFISNSTARTHTRNIYRKLNVHTKQELLNLVEEYSEA